MKVPRVLAIGSSLLLVFGVIMTFNWMISRSLVYKMSGAAHRKHADLKNAIKRTSKPHPKRKKTTVQGKTRKLKQPVLKKQPRVTFDKLNSKNESGKSYLSLLDILKAKNQPKHGKNIFFLQTTGVQKEETLQLIKLTAREACAIESAALHNPGLTVFVLFAGATHRMYSGNPWIRSLNFYKNIRLRRLNLLRYAAGTPIEKWIKLGKIYKSKYIFPHASDLLRYLTLYKYGGIYLDLDVVVLRSLEKMPPNFTGAETSKSLACGVMKMSSTGEGHQIAALCLQDLQANFNANNWGSIGPAVITRVAKKTCNTTRIQAMIDKPSHCKGLTVFDAKAFYAIPWRQWMDFFRSSSLNKTLKATSNSYVIHVWNKFSKFQRLRAREITAYTKYARTNCPRAFAAAGDFF
ncbi:uncharacterized protein Dana_GF16775 [Drosophila ananassae]|uniref:Alpha 1,4-glycosyltransferase domain-containing protein n=1 Tax=Drosophila ananassae TaxID=7217 RepID=B3LYK9_DROAN|nr:lactosylceramide 4-alpha-galactosyltransferase [Drosophila ananassae]EDV42924.2 uncharacterized protein Dana_GF16775 [Drosophila ananassae]